MTSSGRVALRCLIVATPALFAAAWAATPRTEQYDYTQVQARRGESVYAARCAICHGPRMEGVDTAPPLSGARFDLQWRSRPHALYAKVRLSMPQDDPGTLSDDQAADVVAAILRANHLPACCGREINRVLRRS